MKEHRLLLFEAMSRRMQSRLLLLGLALLAVGLLDLFYQPIFGDFWFLVWIALALVVGWWVYYAVRVRRAAVEVHPQFILLSLPAQQIKISYARISNVVSSQIAQHYEWNELSGREQAWVKSFFKLSCPFVQLLGYPEALEEDNRKRAWPKTLFSQRQPGLLLAVDDWLALVRDIETARQRWREAKGLADQEDKRSLAARILDL